MRVQLRARACQSPSSLPPAGRAWAPGRGRLALCGQLCCTALWGRGHEHRPLRPPPPGLVVGPARPGLLDPGRPGSPMLVSCRTNKFEEQLQWVAASAGPRASAGPQSQGSGGERWAASFLRGGTNREAAAHTTPDARPRRSAVSSVPGASPSKYKWVRFPALGLPQPPPSAVRGWQQGLCLPAFSGSA